jgi:hypothetical protein
MWLSLKGSSFLSGKACQGIVAGQVLQQLTLTYLRLQLQHSGIGVAGNQPFRPTLS